MDTTAIIERAAKTNSLLVATDFDGTIAEITNVPAEARASTDALAALATLASSPGVHIAVVSGRELDTLKRFTAALGSIYRVAEHGAFIELPDGTLLDTHALAPADTIDRLDSIAKAIARNFSGMRVERKTSGVAVHMRELEPSRRGVALVSLESFRREASALGMVVMDGRQVIEARSAGASKHAALELICRGLSSETFVLYAGDDTTDEGAITLASRLGGAGIYVASAERPEPSVSVDVVLAAPRAWVELLEALAAARAITSRGAP